VSENGIVFSDEIYKIPAPRNRRRREVSRHACSAIFLHWWRHHRQSKSDDKTRSQSFHRSGRLPSFQPSHLIPDFPELPGRFPIRVELESLSVEDFERILTSTDAGLTRRIRRFLRRRKSKSISPALRHPPWPNRLAVTK